MAKQDDSALTILAAFAVFAAFAAALSQRREIANVIDSAEELAAGAGELLREYATGSGPWANPVPAYATAGVRGLRNNNPGNLKKSGSGWMGAVPHDRNTDPVFEQFFTMPHGVRAAVRLLSTYRSRHGLDTVRGIIERYAPPGRDSNPVNEYRDAVARELGVGLDDPLPDDDATYRRLATALFRFENGGKLPSDSDLAAGFALAGV